MLNPSNLVLRFKLDTSCCQLEEMGEKQNEPGPFNSPIKPKTIYDTFMNPWDYLGVTALAVDQI
jgi:hypothetical protein